MVPSHIRVVVTRYENTTYGNLLLKTGQSGCNRRIVALSVIDVVSGRSEPATGAK